MSPYLTVTGEGPTLRRSIEKPRRGWNRPGRGQRRVIPLSVSEPTVALRRKRIAPNLYERGDRYFLIRKIGGRQVVKALRARNRTEAKKECAHELSKLIDGGLAAVGDRSVTLGQLVDSFLAHEEGQVGVSHLGRWSCGDRCSDVTSSPHSARRPEPPT